MTRTAVIAGVGPGLGESVARRFADEGCQVGLFARSADYLKELEADLQNQSHDVLAVPTDVTREDTVAESMDEVRDAFGPVDILVYNAGNYMYGGLMDISPSDFEQMWRVGAYGAFVCSQEVVPDMLERAGGTVIFTGATSSRRGPANGIAFGSAKFALRGIAESMARSLGDEGIHVAHVVIDGMIDMPTVREEFPEKDEEELLNPDDIADAYWHLVEQNKSAWTLELDVRPYLEDF